MVECRHFNGRSPHPWCYLFLGYLLNAEQACLFNDTLVREKRWSETARAIVTPPWQLALRAVRKNQATRVVQSWDQSGTCGSGQEQT